MKTIVNGITNTKRNVLKARVFLALLLLPGLLAMTGCGLQSAGATDATINSDPPAATITTVSKGAVLDSTSSTDPLFAATVRDCLVNELGAWGGKEDSNLADGADAIQGLDFWLFIVGDNATASYSSEHLHISLPSVGALPARPSLEDDDALDEINNWNKLKDSYEEDYEVFRVAREEAIASLQAFNIYTDQYSGVFSTIGALSGVVKPGADILIASDAENNRDTQIAGRLEGSKVWVLQPTPSGDMAYADELYSNAVGCLVDMGVNEDDITRYRDELAAEAVHDFMTGN